MASRTSFLGLPSELRNAIYAFAFARTATALRWYRHTYTPFQRGSNGVAPHHQPSVIWADVLPLTQVCRQLREETLSYVFAETRVVLFTGEQEASSLDTWLEPGAVEMLGHAKEVVLKDFQHYHSYMPPNHVARCESSLAIRLRGEETATVVWMRDRQCAWCPRSDKAVKRVQEVLDQRRLSGGQLIGGLVAFEEILEAAAWNA